MTISSALRAQSGGGTGLGQRGSFYSLPLPGITPLPPPARASSAPALCGDGDFHTAGSIARAGFLSPSPAAPRLTAERRGYVSYFFGVVGRGGQNPTRRRCQLAGFSVSSSALSGAPSFPGKYVALCRRLAPCLGLAFHSAGVGKSKGRECLRFERSPHKLKPFISP